MFCEPLYGHECIFRLVKECGLDGGMGGGSKYEHKQDTGRLAQVGSEEP